MKFLSRPEELVLLAAWRLKDEAYCLPIKRQLGEVTGKPWSFGAVYDPLDRLEKKGLLESYLADPTPKRGGKSKRIYRLTTAGRKALLETRSIEEEMWKGISRVALSD